MLNINKLLKNIFLEKLLAVAKDEQLELLLNDGQYFTVEPSKQENHGDFACNIAMIFSKTFKDTKPQELAEKIIDKITLDKNIYKDFISKITVAGPGFINITLGSKILAQVLVSLSDNLYNKNFLFEQTSETYKINLEYASPNPTGPMHVGHSRGAIYGDVLAKILHLNGFEVLKEYYINDAGSQIKTLLESVFTRYIQLCGIKKDLEKDFYPGEYLIPVAKKIHDQYGASLLDKNYSEYSLLLRDLVLQEMMYIIKSDLMALKITHNSYFSEYQNLHQTNKIEEAIAILKKKDLLYYGTVENPKDPAKAEKTIANNNKSAQQEQQLIFRSTNFGDDQDRVIKKSNGEYSYFAADLAYILSKHQRGAKLFIMPLGYDHAGYIKRLEAATAVLTDNEAKIKVILCQMVKFIKNGEPLKMSKRAGNFITAKEVIDEIGVDVLRFIMLTRKNDAPFDFDLANVVRQSKDNPVFYVQYAHSRCCSILRNAELENINIEEVIKSHSNLESLISNHLIQPEEISLIKKISNFPRVIEIVINNLEPHRIAFYLQDLASDFHRLWHCGNENHQLKFINKEQKELTIARLILALAVKKIIATALDILNIEPLESM